MTVELGLTPDSRWDTDVTGLVSAAAGAGFAAVGIAGPRADAAAAAALAAAGLRCHELLALVIGADEEATLRQARQLAEAAAVVSAEWVLTTFAMPPDGRTATLIVVVAARACGAMAAAPASTRQLMMRKWPMSRRGLGVIAVSLCRAAREYGRSRPEMSPCSHWVTN